MHGNESPPLLCGSSYYTRQFIVCVYKYTWVRERGREGEGAFKGINYDIIHFYMRIQSDTHVLLPLFVYVFGYFLCNQRKMNFYRTKYMILSKWIARFVVTKSARKIQWSVHAVIKLFCEEGGFFIFRRKRGADEQMQIVEIDRAGCWWKCGFELCEFA